MKRILSFILWFFLLSTVYAHGTILTLHLKQVEREALHHSFTLQAAQFDAQAAQTLPGSPALLYFPRLNLEGGWSYLGTVPSLSLLPGQPPVQFESHHNYDAELAANWILWDSGVSLYQWQSLEDIAKSQKAKAIWLKKQTLLEARLDYFQVQDDLDTVHLLRNALLLSWAQYHDILNRFLAGVSSKLDELSSHLDLLTHERELSQARAQLANALQNLFSLTGQKGTWNCSLPLDNPGKKSLPPEVPAPTVILTMDSFHQSVAHLKGTWSQMPTLTNPEVEIYHNLVKSTNKQSSSLVATNWPQIQISASTGIQYPNGPIFQQVHQNTLGIVASIPLFDADLSGRRIRSLKFQSKAYQATQNQTLTNLIQTWQDAHNQLVALMDQKHIDIQAVQEAQALSKLVYDSYQSGASTYLDVQTADYNALSAELQAAQTKIEILMQMATLASLTN